MKLTQAVLPTPVIAQVAALLRPDPAGGLAAGAWVLCGPPGTGRRSAALDAIAGAGPEAAARVMDTGDAAMTTTQARALSAHMSKRGVRIALGRLDGAAPATANILLKALEESDDRKTWILTARPGRVLPTIASRAIVVRTPALSDADVAAVLHHALRVHAHEATALAAASGGSITVALANRAEAKAHNIVVNLLRGLAEGDVRAASASLRGWGRPEALSLRRWAQEFTTGRWHAFEQGLYPASLGAAPFAAAVIDGTWPSRVRVRALAWDRVAAHRSRKGLTL